MATNSKIGNVHLPVGSYEKDGKTKHRGRKTGELWETVTDSGERRFWLRMHSEVLQPSLLLLNRSVAAKKGDDTTIFNVFPDREETAKKTAREPDVAPDDDIPY